MSAVRKKDCALGARYRQILRHRGHKKAIIAVAHAILEIAYHLLARELTYRELGADYFVRRGAPRVRRGFRVLCMMPGAQCRSHPGSHRRSDRGALNWDGGVLMLKGVCDRDRIRPFRLTDGWIDAPNLGLSRSQRPDALAHGPHEGKVDGTGQP